MQPTMQYWEQQGGHSILELNGHIEENIILAKYIWSGLDDIEKKDEYATFCWAGRGRLKRDGGQSEMEFAFRSPTIHRELRYDAARREWRKNFRECYNKLEELTLDKIMARLIGTSENYNEASAETQRRIDDYFDKIERTLEIRGDTYWPLGTQHRERPAIILPGILEL